MRSLTGKSSTVKVRGLDTCAAPGKQISVRARNRAGLGNIRMGCFAEARLAYGLVKCRFGSSFLIPKGDDAIANQLFQLAYDRLVQVPRDRPGIAARQVAHELG